ncbi:hypothetical protein GZ212_09105 [Mangrovimonas sp. CR14]|uniref:hypothetical protein n=1 Tax=Mangrovimonas sp. CR14 TaxID=2706120 RepID=UPI00141EAC8E|nr:hypothetical protein [Mangrovimonas sp. CR14]NIK92307.1 hypothetical protein [Mangrovimonas sp. CR14]
MKTQVLFLCSFLFVLLGCNNDDDNTPEINKLPPATQTGAGTFGCLVNGEAFVETGTYFNCYYQYVDGEYYFSISAESDTHDILRQLRIATNQAEIEANNFYTLDCNEPGYHYSEISVANVQIGDENTTCETDYGYLEITKLDFTNHIVSGTFEFDIEHPTTGAIIEIREGRFDTLFTQ